MDPAHRNKAKPRVWRRSTAGGVVAHGARTASPLPVRAQAPGGADVVPVKYGNPGDAPPTTTTADGGGPKLRDPGLNLIFWGSGWNGIASSPATPTMADISNDVARILAGPYLTSLRQYGVLGAFQWRVFQFTSSNPPNPFTTQNVLDFILGLIDNDQLPEPDEQSFDQIHCVFMPPGVAFQNSPGQNLTGLHTFATWNDYDLGDVDTDQHAFVMWNLYGSRAAVSTTFSHELAEALSDPDGTGIQVNPTNPNNWNEIGDICASTAPLNGVTVQSYWSQVDQSCVIPANIPVLRQITCITKPFRKDAWHPLSAVGGIDLRNGQPFKMTQKRVIAEVDAGNQFFVVGADGSRANVLVELHYPPGHPEGVRYIATAPDSSKADNLLSLPECPSG